VSIAKRGISAIGKLIALGVLVGAFIAGMAGVVYMSLQGKAVQVPDVTGKDLGDADKELASLGLKIKKRADRVSQEKPGTVIEELPKPGDTVKTGQMIMVVTSRGPESGTAPPPSVKPDQDDSDKIEEMISDKPKKPKANSNANAKKKPDTTRDVNAAAETNSNSTSSAGESNSNKAEKPASNSTEKPKPAASPGVKPPPAKPDGKTVDTKLNKKP